MQLHKFWYNSVHVGFYLHSFTVIKRKLYNNGQLFGSYITRCKQNSSNKFEKDDLISVRVSTTDTAFT